LDGRGLRGEPYGTSWRAFNPAKDGTPILANNPRIREVRTDSPEFQLWVRELLLKAAIVAFGQDAQSFSADERLREFQGFALNPFEKRFVERESSRLHRMWKSLGSLDLVAFVAPDPMSAGIGFGLTKVVGALYALMSDPQFFPQGSAGSPVLRYDWAVANQQLQRQDGTYRKNREYNSLVDQYTALVTEYNVVDDDQRAEELLRQIKELGVRLRSFVEPSSTYAAEGPANAPELAKPASSGPVRSSLGSSGENIDSYLERTGE
jgi:hypothetical protein